MKKQQFNRLTISSQLVQNEIIKLSYNQITELTRFLFKKSQYFHLINKTKIDKNDLKSFEAFRKEISSGYFKYELLIRSLYNKNTPKQFHYFYQALNNFNKHIIWDAIQFDKKYFNSRWKKEFHTEQTIGMARLMVETCEYGNSPILADALDELGCFPEFTEQLRVGSVTGANPVIQMLVKVKKIF